MPTEVKQGRLAVIDAERFGRGDREQQADVVVVGSGAGGAVAAYEMARQGRSVMLLEAGPYVPSGEFNEQYGPMVERLYQDAGAQMNSDSDMVVLQGRCVGGSTVVNAAICFRTPDYVLERWRKDFGLSDFTPQGLEPFFRRVERNLSVHVNGAHERNAGNRILEKGCDNLGWEHRPVARNVKQCALTGFCLAGCASDRKQSMLVTYIPWAIQHGAQVHSDTTVDRVIVQEGRAIGVQASVRNHGSQEVVGKLTVKAKLVIVAAGAIQSPLLLLRSGIANSSGQVGKNLACHPSVMVFGAFDTPVRAWSGATAGSYCSEFAPPDKGGLLLEFGFFGPDFGGVFPFGIGDRYARIMENYANLAGMGTLIHDRNDGTVGYDDDGSRKIEYRISKEDRPAMRKSLRAAAKVFFAAGAKRVFLPTLRPTEIANASEIDAVIDGLGFDPGTWALTTYHPQGTLRMGADRDNTVVGTSGETHDVKGLFVADASLFPTSTMVNPQITVYTLSSYVAAQINERAADYFG